MKDNQKLSVKKIIISLIMVLTLILMMVIQFGQLSLSQDPAISNMINDSFLRILGSIIFIIFVYIFGHKILKLNQKPFLKSLIIIIPALIISINNFPFIPFFNGDAVLTKPIYTIYIFALSCLSAGIFEEVVFRGLILFFFLQKFSKSRDGILYSILISSALFGFMHVFNLFDGANIGDTLLQVIYSFAMGTLWAVMLLKTKNIWLVILLHSLYNFTGLLFPTLGNLSEKYDLITIISTSIIAIAVAIYTYRIFLKLDLKEIEKLYT
ncbi:MAG: CPBP family intramembrane metalloprotease [Acholeplasmataceae bacterium]|nr:CPBP family intramembrane metalloprotease [Acholeplasmataceae bacterium]